MRGWIDNAERNITEKIGIYKKDGETAAAFGIIIVFRSRVCMRDETDGFHGARMHGITR